MLKQKAAEMQQVLAVVTAQVAVKSKSAKARSKQPEAALLRVSAAVTPMEKTNMAVSSKSMAAM